MNMPSVPHNKISRVLYLLAEKTKDQELLQAAAEAFGYLLQQSIREAEAEAKAQQVVRVYRTSGCSGLSTDFPHPTEVHELADGTYCVYLEDEVFPSLRGLEPRSAIVHATREEVETVYVLKLDDCQSLYRWTAEIEVDSKWVADGFNLTDERLRGILSKELGWTREHETDGRVILSPSEELIDKEQGKR